MFGLGLEKNVQDEIRTYFKKINETKHELRGQKGFLGSISPQLQKEVKRSIFIYALIESKCFISLKLKFRRQH